MDSRRDWNGVNYWNSVMNNREIVNSLLDDRRSNNGFNRSSNMNNRNGGRRFLVFVISRLDTMMMRNWFGCC